MPAPSRRPHPRSRRSLRLTPALGLLLVAGLALAETPRNESKVFGALNAEAGVEYGSLSTVNGGITVQAGARVRGAETVNGGISLGEGAEVGKAETVNGGITLANRVRLGQAETVNGGIRIGEACEIDGSVETVNGGIRIGQGSRVGRNADTVNGAITLEGAVVRGRVRTVNGDILLDKGAEAGSIQVEKPNRGWWNWGTETLPRVVIGRNAKVHGPMVFEREVRLFVHASASIGEVQGATPVRYEGDEAPL